MADMPWQSSAALHNGYVYVLGCCLQELQKAVALSPDIGFEKYMYLGQLLQGEEAVAATQKGVELLQQVSNCSRS
jgi:hypothetical protein